MINTKAKNNRTIELNIEEEERIARNLLTLNKETELYDILDKTINQDSLEVLDFLPSASIDLIITDPPYNMNKEFNSVVFSKQTHHEYEQWLDSWIKKLPRILKDNGSIYICSEWYSSVSVYNVLSKYFIIKNRITWERDKGRGSANNWKNNSEDIWFATKTNNYIFNYENVKIKRRVMAPYKDNNGNPKDWTKDDSGTYRLTYSSNIWTDITIPFWSMPENTKHPTQKPEKLIAKLILASSNENSIVLDPFVGSGTTSVVAKKLNRHYIGIDIDKYFCLLTEKRLEIANTDKTIQGYKDGVFWERNSVNGIKSKNEDNITIFDVIKGK